MSAIVARTQRELSPEPGDELARLGSPVGIALIAATVLASGVASYDAYVVNVGVPAIGRQFGAGVAAIQWTPTLLALAALWREPESLRERRSPSLDAVGALLAVLGLGGVIPVVGAEATS